MKKLRAYNVQIYTGLKENYNDSKIHSVKDVRKICDSFVNTEKDCITITKTEYRYVNGKEDGVIIGWIQYPRFPRSRREIRKRAFKLASILLVELGQLKITVTTPYKSYMLTGDESVVTNEKTMVDA